MKTEAVEENVCDICGSAGEESEMAPLAGLGACSRCRTGDVQPVMDALGYENDVRAFHSHSASGGGGADHVQVDLQRPHAGLELELDCHRQKGAHGWFARFMKKTDPEIGIEEFDDNVFLEFSEEHEAAVLSLLSNQGVRQAISWLAGAGCGVSLVGRSMTVGAMAWNKSNLPALDDVARYTLALAIHMDRFSSSYTD